jgi:hypothetical protein
MRSLYLEAVGAVAFVAAVFGLGEVIHHTGFNPFERAIAADGGTALSPFGSSPQAVSPASPLQSLSQGEPQ